MSEELERQAKAQREAKQLEFRQVEALEKIADEMGKVRTQLMGIANLIGGLARQQSSSFRR